MNPQPESPDQDPAEPPTLPGEADFAALAAELDARESDLEAERDANRALLERLRGALLASDRTVEPELVRGVSADELEASFRAAQATVQRVREAVLREIAVPAGAPGRFGGQPSTPLEKIRAGLG